MGATGALRDADSWAWVHYIRCFFALSTLLNHCVLFLVIYQNARDGKI